MQKLLNTGLKIRIIFLVSIVINACNFFDKEKTNEEKENKAASFIVKDTNVFSLPKQDSLDLEKDNKSGRKIIGELEQSIINSGLVNIKNMDSGIVVDLKYSTMDNFLGIDIYGDLENAYLQKDVAEKLMMAQLFLKSKFPYYRLIVYDAARPRSIQRIMWDTIDVPARDRTRYLSNPKYGSLHNYGAAVDVSIMDENGTELDMGTKYDCFDELAYPEKEKQFIREGKLNNKQIANRQLLRSVMQRAGFFNIQTEWWHFNACYRNSAMEKYKIIE